MRTSFRVALILVIQFVVFLGPVGAQQVNSSELGEFRKFLNSLLTSSLRSGSGPDQELSVICSFSNEELAVYLNKCKNRLFGQNSGRLITESDLNSAEIFRVAARTRVLSVLRGASPIQLDSAMKDWLLMTASKADLANYVKTEKQKLLSRGVAPEARETASTSYDSVGLRWILENRNGKTIILDDGSVWEVDPMSLHVTSLWLASIDITVTKWPGGPLGYEYLFIDMDSKERVFAKFLGLRSD
jgi:hypothetical protein